MNWPVQ